MEKIRVLQIVPSLSLTNGVASYIMNYFRNINDIEFDFVVATKNTETPYYQEIEKKNGEVFNLAKENYKNINEYRKEIKLFFKENAKNYDIVHCNVANSGLFFLYYAKKYGINTRIIHSHATVSSDKKIKKIINDMIIPLVRQFATHYFACSEAAGKAMFGNKKFIVINNAIDCNKFKYNEEIRIKIRKQENISNDEILIGTVGRFAPQKNQIFLLEVFKKLLDDTEKKYKLLLIGTGPLKSQLINYAKEKNIYDKIIWKENITNTNEYYQAMDVFVLPSKYEGAPVVGIEAQSSGVACLFSDKITKEVKINENVKYLPIDNVDDWINALNCIKYERIKNVENIKKNNYEIETASRKLEEIYKEV